MGHGGGPGPERRRQLRRQRPNLPDRPGSGGRAGLAVTTGGAAKPYTVWLTPALVERALEHARRGQLASVRVCLGPLVAEAVALWLEQAEAGERAEDR